MTHETLRPWNSRRMAPVRRQFLNDSSEYQDNVFKITDHQVLEEIVVLKYPRAAKILYDMGTSGHIHLGFKAGEVDKLALALKNNSYPFACELAGEDITFNTIDEVGVYLETNFAKKPPGRKKNV